MKINPKNVKDKIVRFNRENPEAANTVVGGLIVGVAALLFYTSKRGHDVTSGDLAVSDTGQRFMYVTKRNGQQTILKFRD